MPHALELEDLAGELPGPSLSALELPTDPAVRRLAWSELHAVYARKARAWPVVIAGDGASHVTVKALDVVEGHVRRVLGIKANPPAYRGMVDDLAGALVTSWGVSEGLVLDAADDIAATVDRHGRGKVGTTRAARRIDRLQADLAAAGRAVTAGPMSETYTRYLAAAFLLGQSETTKPLGWEASFSLVDQDAVAALSRSGLWWIGEHYGDALDTGRLLSEVEGMIRDGMGRVDGGARLRAAWGAEFHRSDAYWRGLASTVATRSRSFGALSGMEATGATVYEYTNPLDERTSDVCEALNGTRFTVKGGVELRERLIGADPASSPEAWKAISPWPKLRDVLGPNDLPLPSSELQAKGIAWPPLHFHCRSSIDVVAWSEISPEDLGDPGALRVERAGPAPAPPSRKPKAPPKPKPVERRDVILGERLAGPSGSNDGGLYRGTDGVRRYVKFYGDPAQAAGEHLANRIYRDLGLNAPRSELFRLEDGRLAYASEILENVGTLGQFMADQPGVAGVRALEALDGFAADILTANWDAAGLDLDNMIVLADGTVARIDNGGTFLFRAQAGRKASAALEATNPLEWTKFPTSNPGYRRLFEKAGITKGHDLGEDLIAQVEAIQALRPRRGGWRAYLRKVDGLEGYTDAELDQVAELLERRTTFLARKAEDARALRRMDELEASTTWATDDDYFRGRQVAQRVGNTELAPLRTAPGLSPGKLAPDEYRAVRDYTGSAYRTMNGNLRGGGAPTARDKALTKAIRRSKLDGDRVLYRGAHSRSLRHLVQDGEHLAEWNTDTDQGFGSTALWRKVATDWAGTDTERLGDKVRIVFRILARKDTPAMWVDDISSNSSETELLIPPGATLRVIRAKYVTGLSSYDPSSGRWEIDAILE